MLLLVLGDDVLVEDVEVLVLVLDVEVEDDVLDSVDGALLVVLLGARGCTAGCGGARRRGCATYQC